MSRPSILEQLTRPRKPLSVSELAGQIRTLVEGRFLDVWVEGEVSNFRKQSSGHWYFSLKDDLAMIRCAFFRSQNRLMKFEPVDGVAVRARGRVSTYEGRSEYQLVVEFVEPSGTGQRQLAFEQLKEKLAGEGLFSADRKRPLPMIPRRIGVVTSPSGAAIRDILRTLMRRNEAVSVLLAPVRVQGEGAAREIAEAVESLNLAGGIDAIIVGRGGGSAEDLSCFNDEQVARAIFNSAAPVISAVGHETDFTLADFVADLRASTPSAAAEIVATARDEISNRVKALAERNQAAVHLPLLRAKHQLAALRSRGALQSVFRTIARQAQLLDLSAAANENAIAEVIRLRGSQVQVLSRRVREADPRRSLMRHSQRLMYLKAQLKTAQEAILTDGRGRLSVAATKLDALSPLSVLGRGYAIAFDAEGKVVKAAKAVETGEHLKVRVADGDIDCTVD